MITSCKETHVSDLRVGTLLGFFGDAALLVHTRAALSAPHTLVFGIGVFTQTAVLTSQRAVIQSDYKKTNKHHVLKNERYCLSTALLFQSCIQYIYVFH